MATRRVVAIRRVADSDLGDYDTEFYKDNEVEMLNCSALSTKKIVSSLCTCLNDIGYAFVTKYVGDRIGYAKYKWFDDDGHWYFKSDLESLYDLAIYGDTVSDFLVVNLDADRIEDPYKDICENNSFYYWAIAQSKLAYTETNTKKEYAFRIEGCFLIEVDK